MASWISFTAANRRAVVYSLIQRAAAIRGRHVRFKKVRDPLVSVDLIFHSREAVAFVFVDFVFDYSPALLDCAHYLLRFRLRTARIIAACQQVQRRFNLVDEIDWRA